MCGKPHVVSMGPMRRRFESFSGKPKKRKKLAGKLRRLKAQGRK